MTLRRRGYLVEGRPSDYSYKQFWAKIDRAKGNKYILSTIIDWGNTRRGQGRRRGRMVMGGMSDAPQGKQKSYDILGKAKLSGSDRQEADSLDTYQKGMFAKALEAGFDSDVAFLVAYSVGADPISREEVYRLSVEQNESLMTLRRRGYLAEGWMAVKRFFNVRNPLFHGTNAGAVTSILLYGEGIKQVASGHFGKGQKQGGISLARTLDSALKFGIYVIVIDRDKLHGEMKPVQYGGRSWEDETEERFYGEIPVAAIRGLIMNRKAQTYEVKEFGERGIVVVQKVGPKYERVV